MLATASVSTDTEAVTTACADLLRAHAAVIACPGAAARELELDFAELSAKTMADLTGPRIVDLGEGHLVFIPPRAFTDLLRRARLLGVI